MNGRLPYLTPEKIALMYYLNRKPRNRALVQFCFKNIAEKKLPRFTHLLKKKNFLIHLKVKSDDNYLCVAGAFFIPTAENLTKTVRFCNYLSHKFRLEFYSWQIIPYDQDLISL